LDSTAAPRSFGTDDPPPPAYIRKKQPDREDKIVDKCNKSIWIRYQDDGKVEVNGSVPTSSYWPEAVDTYREIINAAAGKYIVPASWIAGFIAQESSGTPGAYGPVGSVGLMQLQVSTARWLSDPAFPKKTPGHVGPTPAELSDPIVNIDLGTKFLELLMNKHGNNLMYIAGEYNHGSVECGDEIGLKDKEGNREPCATPDHSFDLITHCGYIDGIIGKVNRAINEGYSGLREINLDTEDVSSESVSSSGASVLSIILGVGLGAGAVAAWRRYMK
jgi:hypothetical protein